MGSNRSCLVLPGRFKKWFVYIGRALTPIIVFLGEDKLQSERTQRMTPGGLDGQERQGHPFHFMIQWGGQNIAIDCMMGSRSIISDGSVLPPKILHGEVSFC